MDFIGHPFLSIGVSYAGRWAIPDGGTLSEGGNFLQYGK